MTPLGASLIFVMISLILSSLKHMFISGNENTTISNIQMSRIFKLTQIAVQKQPQYYKSLYEAYYKSQIEDEQAYTNKLKDRDQFNQSILSESLRNEEVSFVCGTNFMVLVNTMISGSGSHIGWTNTIRIYELPHMRQKDQLIIFGHLQLPKKCKKQKIAEIYELGVINENRPMLLTITSQGKATLYSNILAYLDEYSKEIVEFDSSTNYWAYISKEQPWVIHISEQPFSKNNAYSDSLMNRNGRTNRNNQIYNTNNFLQINMIDIESYQSGIYEGDHRLNIRHIFIQNPDDLYVTCVYEYFNSQNKIKSIVQISFLIKHDQMSILSRNILDTEFVTGATIESDCMIYREPNITQNTKNQYKLGCVIEKQGQQNVKYAHVSNLYAIKYKRKKKSSQDDDETYMQWVEEHFKDLYNGDQDDDLIWMMKRMTPLAKIELFQKYEESANAKLEVYFYPSLIHARLFPSKFYILKPSLPNPIIGYQCKTEYFIFTCYFKQNELIKISESQENGNEKQQKLDYSYFHIPKPESVRIDEQKLRSIKWLDQEELIMICWGGGIQLFRLSRIVEIETDWTAGIPMSSLIPFIELFATVFCLLQVIWRSPN